MLILQSLAVIRLPVSAVRRVIAVKISVTNTRERGWLRAGMFLFSLN